MFKGYGFDILLNLSDGIRFIYRFTLLKCTFKFMYVYIKNLIFHYVKALPQ